VQDVRTHMNRVVGIGAVLFTVLLLTACPPHVKVSDLQHNPGKYGGKEVAVSGTVTESYGLLGNGAYQVDDGSGKIWVLSEGYGIPGKGARVGVTGTLMEGAAFGGKSLGMAIRQTHRTKS
jgi:hypothetical protein